MVRREWSGTSPLAGEDGWGGAPRWMSRLAIAFALIVALILPVTAAEEILTYDVAVVLSRDASAEVTETITANVEGKLIVRGLLRNLPRTMIGDDTSLRQVTNTVLSVTRDGEPEPYAVVPTRSQDIVRIGRADMFLVHKVHTWELRYTISALAGPMDGGNALAWEAIGMDWPFPILETSLTVTLPPGSTIVKPVARIGTALGDLAGKWTKVSATELRFDPSKPVGDKAALSVVILFTGGLAQ